MSVSHIKCENERERKEAQYVGNEEVKFPPFPSYTAEKLASTRHPMLDKQGGERSRRQEAYYNSSYPFSTLARRRTNPTFRLLEKPALMMIAEGGGGGCGEGQKSPVGKGGGRGKEHWKDFSHRLSFLPSSPRFSHH